MAVYLVFLAILGLATGYENYLGDPRYEDNVVNWCYSCSYTAGSQVVYGPDFAGSAGAKEVCAGPLEFPEADKEDLPVSIDKCPGPCFVRYNNRTGELSRGCYGEGFQEGVPLDVFKRDKCGRLWSFCLSDSDGPCNDFFYPASLTEDVSEEEKDHSEWCGEDFSREKTFSKGEKEDSV